MHGMHAYDTRMTRRRCCQDSSRRVPASCSSVVISDGPDSSLASAFTDSSPLTKFLAALTPVILPHIGILTEPGRVGIDNRKKCGAIPVPQTLRSSSNPASNGCKCVKNDDADVVCNIPLVQKTQSNLFLPFVRTVIHDGDAEKFTFGISWGTTGQDCMSFFRVGRIVLTQFATPNMTCR